MNLVIPTNLDDVKMGIEQLIEDIDISLLLILMTEYYLQDYRGYDYC